MDQTHRSFLRSIARVSSVALMAGCAATVHAQTIEWVAGQLGGGWYTMVTGMAKLLEEKNPGMQVKVVPGGGTANPSKIQQGQSQLGMGLDIFAKMSVDGTGIYDKKPHGKVMMIGQSFSDNYVHMLRAKGQKLGFADVFKSKDVRIGVTKSGSSDEMSFRFVMEHYGTSYDKLRGAGYKIFQGDYNELANAFKNNQVDYIFLVLGIPGAAVIDMQQGRDAELVAWPDEVRQKFAKQYGYSVGEFPAKTYPKYQTGAVPTIIMATTLMVSSDLNADTVYKVTKTLCENTDQLPKIHASMDVFNCKTAGKVTPVPLHPGALKYYKEKGFL
jgi:uncharacterized protein